MRVVLVACSKSKLRVPARVRDLYTGSYFRAAVRLAEALGLKWAVLSAKHGLLDPKTVVAPYSATLSGNPAALRGDKTEKVSAEWASTVNGQLRSQFPGATFLCFLSKPYMAALDGLPHEDPLAGFRLGPRVSWLNGQLELVRAERAHVADKGGQPEAGAAPARRALAPRRRVRG